eukprot:CAMPEP_0170479772 /NCGR_PEP_ID=MMETSP0208-20121228/876_1 /TAXON_ID=197538 /ORGANISM="Strombidium inclinatum, Strain S3" /LENGTH=248 /DNA_ID=CAMNT_0010752225 /DNA_START=947 /DNA_END=1693 /DNA_ORIENTATION=-
MPIKRERTTKAEMEKRREKQVSENTKLNKILNSDIKEMDDPLSKPLPEDANPSEEPNVSSFKNDPAEDSEGDHGDSSYGSEEHGKHARKSNNLMKPAHGGVNHGKDKKAANASAVAKASAVPNKTVIKAGPASDLDGGKKRTKERTITEIIEKVSTWRKLYNGVMIPNKQTNEVQLQRWSLEDAAKKVDVSKKSLDDYLLQLRFGKKFGFDFEKHRDSKVGVLRSFVKSKKEQQKAQTGQTKVKSKQE